MGFGRIIRVVFKLVGQGGTTTSTDYLRKMSFFGV